MKHKEMRVNDPYKNGNMEKASKASGLDRNCYNGGNGQKQKQESKIAVRERKVNIKPSALDCRMLTAQL